MASSGLSDWDFWDSYKEKIPVEKKKELSNSPVYSFDHILAAPVSQIFSVRISTCFETCCVSGKILVIDQYGTPYQLFSRELDDPHLITRGHNSLPLHLPNEVLNNCNWSQLVFNLIDSVDLTPIIFDLIDLHEFTESDYDKVQTIRVDGHRTSAFVEYTKFFAAELVFLKVIIVRNEESVDALDDKCEVSGTIVAHYGNTYGAMFPEIMVFEKLSDRPYVHDLSENPIPLLRDCVVVPAYSFLRLYVDLYDSQSHQSINYEVDFPTGFRESYNESFRTPNFLITVNARWIHPYLLLNPSQCSKVGLRRELSLPVPDMLEKPFQGSKASWRKDPSLWHRHSNAVTEVFGVVISHNYDGVLNVCGEMVVDDANCMVHVPFTRDKSNPEMLEKRTSIPIKGPLKCYSGADGLSMLLLFWDVEGHLLIRHDFGWNFVRLESPISWYNRRLCTISAGENGYAATFYQTFASGVEARVNVSLSGNILSDGIPSVYGTIFAKYSNEEYSTEYEKSYYRSVLFKTSREKSEELKSSCHIPLLKSVVAVPIDASLIVEVDIRVCSKDFGEISLKGEREFDFEDDGLPMVISGVDCSLKLSVAWSGLH